MYINMKCKKCRTTIFDQNQHQAIFVNSHNIPFASSIENLTCSLEDTIVFINENHLPDWILDRIDTEKWSKGRINCRQCDARIGAFDFVSGMKCDCSNCILPPVHIIKSKVDLVKR